MAQSRKATIVLTARDLASKKVSGLGSTLKVLGGIAAAVGAYQIGRKLVQGMEHAVELAAIQEAAEKGISQSLRQRGEAVDKLLPQLKKQAAAMQTLTGIGDELILENQRLLLTTGQLATDKLPRATKAALDLAAATGIDQRAAFDLVAKAATGYTSTLSRYGIILSESIPKSEKFDAALAQIQKKFGGQAEARLDTYAGRVDALQARWGDLLEKFGDLIVKSPAVNVLLAGIADILADMTASIKGLENDDSLLRGVALAITDIASAMVAAAESAAPLVGALRQLNSVTALANSGPSGLAAGFVLATESGAGFADQLSTISNRLVALRGRIAATGGETFYQELGLDKAAAEAVLSGVTSVTEAAGRLADLLGVDSERAQQLATILAGRLKPEILTPTIAAPVVDSETLKAQKDLVESVAIDPWIRGSEAAKQSLAITRQLLSQEASDQLQIQSRTAAAREQIEIDATARVLDLRIDAAKEGSAELFRLERERIDRLYQSEVANANAAGAATTDIYRAWALEREKIDRDQAAATQDALAFNAAQFLDAVKQQAKTLTETVLDGVQTLSRGISTALGDLIIRGKDVGDALKQTFESIAQSVLDLLVNQAVQYVATAVLGASASATQHIARMGQLAAETYGAAFAATAAIPFVGPALAPGVAAGSVAAMLTASSGAFAAGTAAGGAQGALPAFLRGGIVDGPTGPDRTTIRATAGETVLDTTFREARAILGGRAKIVPAGDRSDGRVTNVTLTIAAADSRSVYRLLERDPDSFVRLVKKASRLGLLDG